MLMNQLNSTSLQIVRPGLRDKCRRLLSHGLPVPFRAGVLPVLVVVAAFAAANRAAAIPFAATTLSPSSQTVTAGTPFSVDVRFGGDGTYSAYGIDLVMTFDASVVQVASIATGAGSPFTTVAINTFNNTLGQLRYQATGGTLGVNQTTTAATIQFVGIGNGTSPLFISSVNEYIVGYGPYGVNGRAVSGNVTVTGAGAGVPETSSTLALLAGVMVAVAAARRRLGGA